MLYAMRKRIALAICPELATAVDAARSTAAKARWLAEERAELVEQRARELSIERRAVVVGAGDEALEARNEAAVRAAWLAGERGRNGKDRDFENTAARLERMDTIFEGHGNPVLPVVDATDGRGGPARGEALPSRRCPPKGGA